MKEIWLKVLIGLLITLMLGGFAVLDGNKLEKDIFVQHEVYQQQQMRKLDETLKDGFNELKGLIKEQR